MVHIIHDTPTAEGAGFNFDTFASVIEDIVVDPANTPPLTIGIDGPWGVGKTSLMRFVERRLLHPGPTRRTDARLCLPVWFNAWKYAGEKEILHAMLCTIMEEMAVSLRSVLTHTKLTQEQHKSAGKIVSLFDRIKEVFRLGNLWEDLKSTYKENPALYSGAAGVSYEARSWVPITFAAGTFFKDLGTKLFTRFSGTGESALAASEEVVVTEENILENLKGLDPDTARHQLLLLTEDILTTFHRQTGAALCVFIDDLDRCKWQRIPEILEGIKLHLDNAGCFFVLGLDLAIAAKAIESEYLGGAGDGLRTGNDYLEKLIQVKFTVPTKRREDVSAYVQALLERGVLNQMREHLSEPQLGVILACVSENPRQIKRFLNGLTLSMEISRRTPGGSLDAPLLAKWETIQFFRPMLCEFMRQRRADFLAFQDNLLRADSLAHLRERLSATPLGEKVPLWLDEEKWFDLLRMAPAFTHETLGLAISRAPAVNPPVGAVARTNTSMPPLGSQATVQVEGRLLSADVYPVTVAQYAAFLHSHGNSRVKRPLIWPDGDIPESQRDHPVRGVSARDAETFAAAFGRRLLTAEEWKCIAWGDKGRQNRFPWGDDEVAENCNVYESGHGDTTPVNIHVNGYASHGQDRIFDLIGNVWEWVAGEASGPREQYGGCFLLSISSCKITTSRMRRSEEPDALAGFRTCAELPS